MYHGLALLLLAYLVWRRPAVGAVVGTLEGMWLLWPLYGLPQPFSFNVHLALAITCLFAWRREDPRHSVGLALGGALVLGLPHYVPVGAPGRPAAVLAGFLCGELVACAWVAARVVRMHSEGRGPRSSTYIARGLQAVWRLNAPLGTRREGRSSTDFGSQTA